MGRAGTRSKVEIKVNVIGCQKRQPLADDSLRQTDLKQPHEVLLNMIPRFLIVSLLSVLLAMSTVSCAPNIREMNLSQEVVDNLPKDQALSFLQTLGPSQQIINIYCRFEEDGIARWEKQSRQFLPGKYPYTSFSAVPRTPGIMIVIFVYLDQQRSRDPWCMIAAEGNADQQGKDAKQFTAKILTALLSMGVRVTGFGGEPIRARRPTTQ